jgi:predicted nucleic acid-binding protein
VDVVLQHPPAILWFSGNAEVLYAPGFALMELVEGCRSKLDLAMIVELPKIVLPVWPSASSLQIGFDLFAQYYLSHNLGLIDSLIAATALEQGATLCTFNMKHFAVVPGLTTEQPYKRA